MLILRNANIQTLDPQLPKAQAIVIEQGNILYVGSDSGSLAYEIPGCIVEDMHGRFVHPGFIDAHLHLQLYADALQFINCETATRAECMANIAEKAKTTPAGNWIFGTGWSHDMWPEGMGTKQHLDQVAPDHPVYLEAKSYHAGWANSRALQLAGLDGTTPDPVGGKLGRLDNGELDGVFYEDAIKLIETFIPHETIEQIAHKIERAQSQLWRNGITAVHDFDGRECFLALQTLHQRHALKVRVCKGIRIEDYRAAVQVGLQAGFGDDLLRIGSVKLFADGALGPHTAAMTKDYENEPGNRGMLLLDKEEILQIGMEAAANRLGLAIHAIGDRANHEVLDAFAMLRGYETEQGLPHLRHRIEHVQVLNPEDVSRLAELNLIASMQPTHVISDFKVADQFWGARSEFAYALQSLRSAGTRLALGSDAPVEVPNPFHGLHAAVTRYTKDHKPSLEGWYPAQRLTLEQAVHGFTLGAAYAAEMEDRQGMLKAGYLADLLVLDQDIYSTNVDDLRSLTPKATMVNGEWVWKSDNE